MAFNSFFECKLGSEQEFMVRWLNTASKTFQCSNGIRQVGQLSRLMYNVCTDDLNHHLQLVTGVGCYVGGAWINSQCYADDMVLLAPTETAFLTQGNCFSDTVEGM